MLCCWELWLIQIPGKVKWASQSWLYWCLWVTLGPDCICSLVPASSRTFIDLWPHTCSYLLTKLLPWAPQCGREFSDRTVVTESGHLYMCIHCFGHSFWAAGYCWRGGNGALGQLNKWLRLFSSRSTLGSGAVQPFWLEAIQSKNSSDVSVLCPSVLQATGRLISSDKV